MNKAHLPIYPISFNFSQQYFVISSEIGLSLLGFLALCPQLRESAGLHLGSPSLHHSLGTVSKQ